jgi:hypothetical protein
LPGCGFVECPGKFLVSVSRVARGRLPVICGYASILAELSQAASLRSMGLFL